VVGVLVGYDKSLDLAGIVPAAREKHM